MCVCFFFKSHACGRLTVILDCHVVQPKQHHCPVHAAMDMHGVSYDLALTRVNTWCMYICNWSIEAHTRHSSCVPVLSLQSILVTTSARLRDACNQTAD